MSTSDFKSSLVFTVKLSLHWLQDVIIYSKSDVLNHSYVFCFFADSWLREQESKACFEIRTNFFELARWVARTQRISKFLRSDQKSHQSFSPLTALYQRFCQTLQSSPSLSLSLTLSLTCFYLHTNSHSLTHPQAPSLKHALPLTLLSHRFVCHLSHVQTLKF